MVERNIKKEQKSYIDKVKEKTAAGYHPYLESFFFFVAAPACVLLSSDELVSCCAKRKKT